MVGQSSKRPPLRSTGLAAFVLSLIAAAVLSWMGYTGGGFDTLWWTTDQQGQRLYEQRDFAGAALRFEDPAWKAVALYRNGQYAEAADTFARLDNAQGFYNRGNAFMKGFEYARAITAYEEALRDSPQWQEAAENLALARHTLDYVEDAREQSSTGKLEADDVVYDNERQRGQEIEVDRESTLQAESAEKWMRSVDTETAEFLRTRFRLEASRQDALR